MPDKNWEQMMSDWQSCKIADTNDLKELEDIKKLEDKTRRKARSMKFFMWGDIIGALIILIVFGYQFTQEFDFFKMLIFGGGLLVMLPSAFLSIWYRRGAWNATGTDTKAYLMLALKRNISAINLSKLSAMIAALVGPFLIAVILWRGLTHPDNPEWPWNRYFFGSLFQFILFTGMYIGSRWYQKGKQTEQIKLKNMIKDLESDSLE